MVVVYHQLAEFYKSTLVIRLNHQSFSFDSLTYMIDDHFNFINDVLYLDCENDTAGICKTFGDRVFQKNVIFEFLAEFVGDHLVSFLYTL